MNIILSSIESVAALVPAQWIASAGQDTVIARVYWCAHPLQGLSEMDPITLDLPDDVRAVLFHGRLKYFRTRDRYPVLISEEEMDYVGSPLEEAIVEEQGPEGAYLLLLSRYPSSEEDVGERVVARIKLNAAAGLMATFNGRNIIHTFICELALRRDSFDADWGLVHNPFTHLQPSVAPERVADLVEACAAIEAAPPSTRERTRLALRWFETSLRQFSVDAFVANWIAIETFSSARNSPHRDIHAKLAGSYSMTIEEAQETFRVDRLWKLRNGLVHNGKLVPIMPPIPDYMQALFVDLQREEVNLPTRRVAIALVQDAKQRLHARIEEAIYMVGS